MLITSMFSHYAFFFSCFVGSLVSLSMAVDADESSTDDTPSNTIYLDPKASREARTEDLYSRLTQDEKIKLLAGTGFGIQPIERLSVPGVEMADAGQGVRGGNKTTEGPATLFASGMTMASTWNSTLLRKIGAAIGVEGLNKGTGVHIMLGPAVNITRAPLNGRNGEYMGEDPFLTAQSACEYILGMQNDANCLACIKHFACNNEEADRMWVDVNVSERTLHEIYLPAFETAVKKAHVRSVMSSYNQVNGFHASANKHLLTDILRDEWGFDGVVMSDWGGVHETKNTILSGNDLEMPDAKYLTSKNVKTALKNGDISQTDIDRNSRNIVRAIVDSCVLDGPHTPDHSRVGSPEHMELSYRAACEGIVLLKNQNNILPLDAKKIKTIALIGPAVKKMQYGAEGSPHVDPITETSPFDGIKSKLDSSVKINYVEIDAEEALNAARDADIAILCVNTLWTESEGVDRESMLLPGGQDALISAVASVNSHTVVALNNGAPVEMANWIENVDGVLETWLPGEEGGKALADILFGDINPSGKLPETLAFKREDYPDTPNFHTKTEPGSIEYAEGIYVGYRYFDKKNIKPLFPFGFGLSYTSFDYSDLRLSSQTLSPSGKVTVTVDVKNTGEREGAEVVQLYIRPIDPIMDRPIRELKGFVKLDLKPGEAKKATFALDARSFAHWDEVLSSWKVDDGAYAIEAAASSSDIRLSETVRATGVNVGD